MKQWKKDIPGKASTNMVSSGCHFSQGTRKTLIFNINVEPEGMTDIKPHFGKIPAVRVLFRNKSEADFDANYIPQV
jgi:hypothetical protein